MIYEGEHGSVSAYYKNKLIVSRPLTKKRTLEVYKREADRVIIEGMRLGHSIQFILKTNQQFLKLLRYKEKNKKPDREERDLIFMCMLILIKFKIIEEEGEREGLLVMPRIKTRSGSETH